jgi:hypothetical protein
MRRAVAPAGALLLTAALVACSPGGSGRAGSTTSSAPVGAAASTTAAEPVRRRVVPLPDTVRAPENPIWSSDGSRIVFAAMPAGSDAVQIYTVRENGRDLRCLSCDAPRADAEPLLKPFPFEDGRRVLLRVGEQSPVSPADHAVLECTPSVADCRRAAVVPITPPDATDPGVVQDQREYRIAPDGVTVGLTQIRSRPGGDPGYAAIVGRLVRRTDHYEVSGPRVVSDLGELKNFTPDGRSALVSGFSTMPYQAGNPDDVRIDLRTGRITRVTFAGDYDEDIDVSPDGRWYVVGSGRAAELFDTVSQVRRPNFLGPGLEALTGYLFVSHRAELLEPWLVRMGAEARGALGQQLNAGSNASGYDARVPMAWSPTGDSITYWETSGNPFAPATVDSRIVVDHLTGRRRVPRSRPAASPVPDWAPTLAGYVPAAFSAPRSRDGHRSGRASVTSSESGGRRTVTVVFDRFSDDGEWVVSGTESATFSGGLTGETGYRADLTLSGAHRGFLRADAPSLGAGGLTGTIVSEVDGHRLELPRPPAR